MSKTLLQWLLVGSIAYMGCSSNDGTGGTGGSGATGGSGPISFDADNALSASSANVIALAASAQLGLTVTAVIGALGEMPPAAQSEAAPKQGSMTLPLPGLCPRGGDAVLSYDPSFDIGDDVTLTFTACAGTLFSEQGLDGTLVLTIEAVSGGFPSAATAVVDLTAPGITVDGTFKALGSVSGATLDLCLGDQRDTDLLTITTANGMVEFACFKIRQVISLLGGGASSAFEPVGVVRLNGGLVYTLNDYTQTPPNITFSGSVAISGRTDSSSGDGTTATIRPETLPNSFCAPFGKTAPGDNSIVSNEFAGDSCVLVDVVDASGTPTSYETTWNKLLTGDTTPGGATCGDTTEAAPGPAMCDFVMPPPQGDLVTFADAYIRGDGSDGIYSGTNYGAAGNLLLKTVSDQSFTRKTYIAFDLPDDLVSASFTKASLVLTLQRHIVTPDRPDISGPQPTNVYGIVDGDDWNGVDPPEVDDTQSSIEGLNWSNAPKNIIPGAPPTQSQFASTGVSLLIPGYTFDLPPVGTPDPPTDREVEPPVVTRYALDVTDYVVGRLDDSSDTDKVINILLAITLPENANVDGSAFLSKETAEECDRPFLRFE